LCEGFAGDWNTSEKKERTQFSSNRGERNERRLGAGAAVLVMERHCGGTAGPLSYVIVVGWDKDAGLYDFFTCFKDMGSGCEVRGTAHWDGDKFVNDDAEVVDGKKLRFRDAFKILQQPRTRWFSRGSKIMVRWSRDRQQGGTAFKTFRNTSFPRCKKWAGSSLHAYYAFCACRRRNVGTSRSSPGTSRATSRTFCWT
jgi:hypothetical protein